MYETPPILQTLIKIKIKRCKDEMTQCDAGNKRQTEVKSVTI